jgi:periplasmic divalent cation tolerance protein
MVRSTVNAQQFFWRKARMPEVCVSARVVLSTAASPEEAARIGRTLVEERLAACATLVPGVQSIYPWKGAIESSMETLLLIKTSAGQIAALEARLHELHSYETPEFLVLDVDGGSRGYLGWLAAWLERPDTPAL